MIIKEIIPYFSIKTIIIMLLLLVLIIPPVYKVYAKGI